MIFPSYQPVHGGFGQSTQSEAKRWHVASWMSQGISMEPGPGDVSFAMPRAGSRGQLTHAVPGQYGGRVLAVFGSHEVYQDTGSGIPIYDPDFAGARVELRMGGTPGAAATGTLVSEVPLIGQWVPVRFGVSAGELLWCRAIYDPLQSGAGVFQQPVSWFQVAAVLEDLAAGESL